MMADASADGGQGVFFLDKLQGFLVFALGSQSHISLDRNVRRAGRLAGGGAALFNGKAPGTAWAYLRNAARRSLIPMSYSFLRATGQTRAHSPQPVHFEMSM